MKRLLSIIITFLLAIIFSAVQGNQKRNRGESFSIYAIRYHRIWKYLVIVRGVGHVWDEHQLSWFKQ